MLPHLQQARVLHRVGWPSDHKNRSVAHSLNTALGMGAIGTTDDVFADVSVRAAAGRLKHIAIIPDGNRRWALSRGLPPGEGHRRGFLEVSPALLQAAWANGIHTMTLWLFSTQNWRRSEQEVSQLMRIYNDFLSLMLTIAKRHRVRMNHLGRKDRLPTELLESVLRVEAKTSLHTKHVFNFGLDYGGRDEVVRLIRRLVTSRVRAHQIDESLVDRATDCGDQRFPNPDLLIRTSGDTRLSGLMPWQLCYSEFFFVDAYYPDFDWYALRQAIAAFDQRQRRFGT